MRAFHPLYLCVLLLLTACSSINTVNSNKDTVLNIASHERVHNAYDKTAAEFDSIKDDKDIAIYAPNLWKRANNQVTRMHDIVKRFHADDQGFFGGPSESKVLSYVMDAQASLDKAKQHSVIARDFLKQPMEDLAFITPKVTEEWQREFQGINRTLTAFILALERNNNLPRHTNNRDKLQARIITLEVKIITAEVYRPLKQQADKLDERLIPITYAKTSQDLAVLNSHISTAPRDTTKINELAETVKQDLLRAEQISQDVSWINRLKSSQREKAVLHYRNKLEALSKKLFDTDNSTLSFTAQIDQLEVMFNDKIATKKVVIEQNVNIESNLIDTQVNAKKPLENKDEEPNNNDAEIPVNLVTNTEENITTIN